MSIASTISPIGIKSGPRHFLPNLERKGLHLGVWCSQHGVFWTRISHECLFCLLQKFLGLRFYFSKNHSQQMGYNININAVSGGFGGAKGHVKIDPLFPEGSRPVRYFWCITYSNDSNVSPTAMPKHNPDFSHMTLSSSCAKSVQWKNLAFFNHDSVHQLGGSIWMGVSTQNAGKKLGIPQLSSFPSWHEKRSHHSSNMTALSVTYSITMYHITLEKSLLKQGMGFPWIDIIYYTNLKTPPVVYQLSPRNPWPAHRSCQSCPAPPDFLE